MLYRGNLNQPIKQNNSSSNQKIIKRDNSPAKQKAIEWINCKNNPFYFMYNYVYIPEHATGGSIKLTSENLNPKMKRVVRSIYLYHKAILMASRQLGKSSIAACLIAWAMVFYPGVQVTILNMKKKAGLQNLATVKFIIKNLPSWMITNKPFKSKSEIVTYLDLFNNSHLDVFYPSTVHDSSTIARSLTVPILYIDEVAFIKNMLSIYGLMLVPLFYKQCKNLVNSGKL